MTSQTSSKSSAWEKTKASSRHFFNKVGEPVNKATNKLGAEAFWPTSLDKEADKAARILRSFCIDGFVAKDSGKHGKSKDKIPPEVCSLITSLNHLLTPIQIIRNCKGLAIFTVMRTGFHWSGAGGSGVVVARLPNGQWSPPAGILIHTLGWGLMAGVDIYDCVCVINNDKGMDGFTRLRATLGADVSAAVGPLGAGSQVESEIIQRQAPVWSYTKGRGLYVGAAIDGTVIVQRPSENERFYGRESIKNTQILAGEVQPPPGTMVQLWETLSAIDDKPHDASKLPPPNQVPGDHELEKPKESSHSEYEEFGAHTPDERMDHKA
jgi:lipid-binding SYLF domain-containing protein